MQQPTVERIRTFPIKSLSGVERERAELLPGGALDGDREYAVVDADGEYVNGKRTAAVHRLDATVDRDAGTVTLGRRGDGDRREFDLSECGPLNAWLSDYFGEDARVIRDDRGMPDDADARGPTVISTGTLREVASWFPDVPVESVRRRFRASVEVGGVPAFWEDRLYAADGPRRFEIGGVRFAGDGPCNRCVVPTRDPDTGEPTPGFRETFLARREATLPGWAPAERFDHFYKLMVNTRVPESEWGESIAVGDPVRLLDE